MNRKKFYPTKILSIRNLIILIVAALAWYINPEISLMFTLFLIFYSFFILSTYKVEKSDIEIKFYRLLREPKEFKWSEIEKVDYEKNSPGGFIWRGLIIYFLIGDTYHRFNIKSFDKLLLDEIINECKSNNIPARDTT